ncbi:hypothetical protein LC087_01265 [Bacillus carboniphilus]|uniref:Uncharacterized protein n=1 Tax=Bacillus carboniphilus TaxID=86663 RepID=A0ABY9JU55_9BACI|nr:hypothetical protein [Bacillus carboniphilus]WLR42897.1 hypothetical protein LC087_01265 [Bacillus carboniphilus]
MTYRNPINIAYNFKKLFLSENNPESVLFKSLDSSQPVSIYVESLTEDCEIDIEIKGKERLFSTTLVGLDATVLAGNQVCTIIARCVSCPNECELEYGLSIGDPNTRIE